MKLEDAVRKIRENENILKEIMSKPLLWKSIEREIVYV